jgi:ribonucleotide monophosphatase NagD (HAD superfamily)
MQRIDSIEQCLEQCTGVLLDQFGVLHDGKVPYPHAVAAVQKLADAGKQIIILSNSSRRSGGTIGKLAKMGFKEEWFTGALAAAECQALHAIDMLAAQEHISSYQLVWLAFGLQGLMGCR